jgi:hypothetical protein
VIRFIVVLLLVCFTLPASTEPGAAGYSKQILDASLDPQECYRVRDITLQRDDIKIYLTYGHLIFGKPINGRRVSAVFSADGENEDGEVLLLPPHRSERASLAKFVGSPNLDEHVRQAVFIFTDDTADQLMQQIRSGEMKKAPDMGLVIAGKWDSVVKNLSGSLEVKLVQDQYLSDRANLGFFYAVLNGTKVGNFDISYEPRAREQISVGQVATRDNRLYFNIWTSFQGRQWRTHRRELHHDSFAISDVHIDAELDANLHLKAVTRNTIAVSGEGGTVIDFDISSRETITDARIDGEPMEVFTRDSLRANLGRATGNQLFLLVSPKPLIAGKTYEVELHHEGDVIMAAGNGVYFVGARENWYPNRGSGFARYDLRFRYPKQLTLVSSGEIAEDTTVGDSRITRRVIDSPIRFAGFNLGQFTSIESSHAGLSVDVYANRKLEKALTPKAPEVAPEPVNAPPRRRVPQMPEFPPLAPAPDPAGRLRELAAEISAEVEFMSANFGPPALKKITVSPIPGTFGQGFPGLLYLSTLSYLNPHERPARLRESQSEQMFYSDLLHAHEVAHQWWGNVVASASPQDDWIMEALANYSALMFLEKKKGRKALDSEMGQYRNNLLRKEADGQTIESAGPIIWGTRLSSSQAPGAWRTITYEKGAWIVHMLRGRLGDEAFLKMLASMISRYRYKTIATDQFRELAAEFLPAKSPDPKLEDFFAQWVYGTGIPTIKMSVASSGRAPAMKVRGTVEQSDVDDDFSALVPVEAQLAGRKSIVKWVQTSSEPVQFTMDLKLPAVKILLDPNGSLLAVKK